jgi:hypothetical protein
MTPDQQRGQFMLFDRANCSNWNADKNARGQASFGNKGRTA